MVRATKNDIEVVLDQEKGGNPWFIGMENLNMGTLNDPYSKLVHLVSNECRSQ